MLYHNNYIRCFKSWSMLGHVRGVYMNLPDVHPDEALFFHKVLETERLRSQRRPVSHTRPPANATELEEDASAFQRITKTTTTTTMSIFIVGVMYRCKSNTLGTDRHRYWPGAQLDKREWVTGSV